jgi:hypothetical protein
MPIWEKMRPALRKTVSRLPSSVEKTGRLGECWESFPPNDGEAERAAGYLRKAE